MKKNHGPDLDDKPEPLEKEVNEPQLRLTVVTTGWFREGLLCEAEPLCTKGKKECKECPLGPGVAHPGVFEGKDEAIAAFERLFIDELERVIHAWATHPPVKPYVPRPARAEVYELASLARGNHVRAEIRSVYEGSRLLH
ncbi:hypothetical protein KGM48_01170 [Patescibacteria group bacterium]|nr:hypothetical protein [Patescibacteria group bacterium]